MYLIIFILAFVVLFVLMSISRYIASLIDSRHSKNSEENRSADFENNPNEKVIEVTDFEIKDDTKDQE